MGITLDEAITYTEKVAEENQRVVDTGIVFNNVTIDMLYCDDTEVIEEHLANYQKRAEEHRQLAEWLKDYKRLLEEQETTTKNDVSENNVDKIEPVIRDNGIENELNRDKDELEPCEDAIGREDALMALCRAVHKNDDTIPCPNQRVSCLWGKTKVQDYAEEIYKLSSVNSQPKTGHWVYKIYGEFHEQGDWYCSKCNYPFNYGYGHAEYCPKCGCKMSETPTEEVIGDRDYDWVIKR